MDSKSMTRVDVLEKAERYVSKDRNTQYGEPFENHKSIAEFWNTYLSIRGRNHDDIIEVGDISIMLILMKIARLGYNPRHIDSWVDIAGYAACGGEIASKTTLKVAGD